MATDGTALAVDSLCYAYRARGRLPWRRRRLPAVRGVSLRIRRGETLGLVGESGCGKSTLARAIMRLLEPDAGTVTLDGRPFTGLSRADLRRRRHEIQMVFQDPDLSLSPRRTVAQTLAEAQAFSPSVNGRTPAELLALVGLDGAMLERFPWELSGGQRQRVSIARALAPGPGVLVADEPVSALDVSVQAQILNLLMELQDRLGLAVLFISHDLAVVHRVSHRIAVMYLGEIVESGPAASVLADPAHPYTRALLETVPEPDPAAARRRLTLPGEVPSPESPPPGCPFHPRCPRVMDVCRGAVPREVNVGTEREPHPVRCHLHDGEA